MFGEGVVAVPDATRAANDAPQARVAREQVDEQLLQRRAQSRGLWTDGGEPPTAQASQPRAGTLPRAVVGTPSPASAANSNYRPSIGSDDQVTGTEAPLTAADRSITADTIDIRMEDVKQQVAAATKAEPAAAPRAEPAPNKAAKLPTLRPSASPNTTLLLALILIAAVAAVLFIGAAVGLWSLPWGKPSSGRSSLGKTIPAKSLPEMHTQPPPAAAAPAPAPAAAAAPAVAPVAAPGAPSMEADEAAPLRAPTLSGTETDDPADRPSPEIAQLISAARTELRSGHPKEAEALLRPYLEKNPDEHHVAEALAQALLARGAAVEAVGIAQKIVKKKPKRASYQVLLGDALRRAGDEPSAKLAYKSALALDPKSKDAQRKLKSKPEAKSKTAAPAIPAAP